MSSLDSRLVVRTQDIIRSGSTYLDLGLAKLLLDVVRSDIKAVFCKYNLNGNRLFSDCYSDQNHQLGELKLKLKSFKLNGVTVLRRYLTF